ncbi:MAG TPA: serine/threonine-protein kinase [Dehalococcoidia bacterium]|nr:serine/threonine-protein kinase [Dehalococcoidia bacterium]
MSAPELQSLSAERRPGDRIDQFEIVRLLGHGLYAASYLAVDRGSGERVVLKLPIPATIADPSSAARFRREASIVQRLRHANIQGAAHADLPRDAGYIALEYVDGRPLRDWLESDAPPTVAEAVNIAVQVALALQYAHEHGVVHRDLKPENILVLPNGRVKLIDFGNARLQGMRRLTWRVRGDAAGTPDYMAPEQVEGARGDPRTDLYALGVLLFELLSGRVPFDGDNANAVMYQQVHSDPPSLDRFRPGIPPVLQAIVSRALRKRPDDRYQHAADFARDLLNYDGPAEAGRRAAADGAPATWLRRIARRLPLRIRK